MKLWRIIAALGAGLLVLGSCNGPEPEEPVLPAALTAPVLQLEPASGSVFLSVTASKEWNISVSGGTWATVSPASGTGSRNSVIFSYEANESEDARNVTLTLTANPGGQASLTLTQKGVVKPEVPPEQYGGYGYDVAAPHWLELPATKAGDGCEWFVHSMDGGDYFKSHGQRNYSFYWNYEEHLSLWVAYPLNKGLYGSQSYPYVWGYDPLLPMALQPNLTVSSYGGVGFDKKNNWNRGHQIPRADRQTTQAAVASTCYPTNLTPQDGTFNAGVWALLESKVRGYAPASSDTLYVVTGCVLDGSTTFTESKSGFAVRVPSAYFKALLRPSPTLGISGYMACGFYLPHSPNIKADNNVLMSYIMSIDELEKKTGIEFFVNLAEKVGADNARKIKSQEPGSWWK